LRAFATEAGYDTYILYRALKQHFSKSSYDFFKYGGKVRASGDTFASRRDVYYFHKLSEKPDPKGWFLSVIPEKPDLWIGDILDKKQEYIAWKGRVDGLTYHVKSSLSKLPDTLQETFGVQSGSYPEIINLYLQKEVSLETLTVLASVTNSVPYWEQSIDDPIFIPKVLLRIRKYAPFLTFDQQKFQNLVKEHYLQR